MNKIIYSMLFFGLVNLASVIAQEPPEPPPIENIQPLDQEPFSPPDTADLYFEFFKMMFMLGLIISFLLLILYFFRRMMNARVEQLNTSSLIKIVERRGLSPRTTLYIIEVSGKELIFAESNNGVTALFTGTESKIPEESF